MYMEQKNDTRNSMKNETKHTESSKIQEIGFNVS